MPPKFQKDDQVFIAFPDQPANKAPPGPRSSFANNTASSSNAPSKWFIGKVTNASSETAIKIMPENKPDTTKEVEIRANEFESKIISKAAVKEFISDANFDLAALPRNIKTKMLLDCFLKSGERTLLAAAASSSTTTSSTASSPNILPLACETGGFVFRESCPQYEQERVINDKKDDTSSDKSIIINNFATFSAMISSKFGSQAGDTLDNIRRLFAFLFGEDNVTKNTSFIFTSASSFCVLPQFTMSKAGILPSGESVSSAVERAAEGLGISSDDVQLAISWLQGVEKLWRLTPAGSGFKGTEPDLIEAASYLLSSSSSDSGADSSSETAADSTKFLANFLSTDKGNTKAPVAQFDEKRIAIAECVTQEICSKLFFGKQYSNVVEDLEKASNNNNKVIVHLCDVPTQTPSDGLDIKATPITSAICEFLKQTFIDKKSSSSSLSASDLPIGKLLTKFDDIMTKSSVLESPEEFSKNTYADTSKAIISEFVSSDFPQLASAGKDGFALTTPCFAAEKFKVSSFGWAARIFIYRSFFEKSKGGSKHFDLSFKLVDAFTKSWQSKKFLLFFNFQPSSPSVEDFLVFLASAVEYYREQPVEVFDFAKVESLRCMAFTTNSEKAGNSDPFLSTISSKLLEKIAAANSSTETSTFGSYNSESMSLCLSVLGKVGFDKLQTKFGETTLSHVFKHVQYQNSALITLKKCCKKTVQVAAGSGILSRLSTQIVAEKSVRRLVEGFQESKREERENLEFDEEDARKGLENDQKRYLAQVMGSSGAFLKPLIRRRKDRTLREEMDLRMETMTQESKMRRVLVELFFDELPDDPVPEPVEAKSKMQKRYDLVKPTQMEEEEARKEIVNEARESIVKLVAELEVERDQVAKKYPFVKKPDLPWEKYERAAERRRMDEENAFTVLFGEQPKNRRPEVLESQSPSRYYSQKQQEEDMAIKKHEQEVKMKKQLEARLALIQQERQREIDRLEGRTTTTATMPMNHASVRSFSNNTHQSQRTIIPATQQQYQQQQVRHQDPYNQAKELLKKYSSSTPGNNRDQPDDSTYKPPQKMILNEQNQKSGPAPLRVSFGAYWANQYKK